MQETKRNQQEVVVVTGASAGVGRATVRRFAREGAKVGLIARGADGLEGAQRDVEALGGKAFVYQADVSDAEAVEAAAEAIEAALGPIDIWVNNAMVSVFSPFKEMKPEEFKRVTEVTYLGYVYGTMAALKRMLPRDRGTIVQVGSALAYRGIPLQSAYCGSKHAIQGFTEAVRTELMHDNSNVHITMVQMPALNTPQFNWVKTRLPHKPQPVPPIFQPEVAAEAIYYAAHNHRREMTVGMNNAILLWGNKFFPGYGDRYLAQTGFQSQQYDGAVEPDRQNNLWEPVPGDFGAHGDFDDRAHSFSRQLWLNMNRSLVATIGAAALVVGALAMLFAGSEESD